MPVRRLALYLERSLDRGLEWAAFEPNDDLLWANVRMRVGEFLHRLFKAGAFAGRKADEAYFVKCDEDTMTPDDVADGRLVGARRLRPAQAGRVRRPPHRQATHRLNGRASTR